ncbi:hypothetical protein Tco_1505746 [Tanacetum coccineum]
MKFPAMVVSKIGPTTGLLWSLEDENTSSSKKSLGNPFDQRHSRKVFKTREVNPAALKKRYFKGNVLEIAEVEDNSLNLGFGKVIFVHKSSISTEELRWFKQQLEDLFEVL